jgi:hypothetical protein
MSDKATTTTTETPSEATQSGVFQTSQQPGATTSQPTGAGVNTGAGITRPKTEAEIEADRRYEEAIEEEYAKREGGA